MVLRWSIQVAEQAVELVEQSPGVVGPHPGGVQEAGPQERPQRTGHRVRHFAGDRIPAGQVHEAPGRQVDVGGRDRRSLGRSGFHLAARRGLIRAMATPEAARQAFASPFEVAIRVNTWIAAFHYFRSSPEFDDAVCLAFLRGLLVPSVRVARRLANAS